MCNVCFKEFRGWCKSFTRTEALLSILEGVLLVLVFVLLVFLILHFLVCTNVDILNQPSYNVETTAIRKTTTYRPNVNVHTTFKLTIAPQTPFSFVHYDECTWKPSEKTRNYIKYYQYNTTSHKKSQAPSELDYQDKSLSANKNDKYKHKYSTIQPVLVELGATTDITMENPPVYEYKDETDFLPDNFDGEEADDFHQQYVLALVKVNPPRDIIFGCILTIITEYWTITSASCIEAIEEVDSLDLFVMMEDYGRVRKGRSHIISDVRVHPMYEGVNKSYDLSALKSEDSLMMGSGYTVDLPSLIDYFMITIGEKFVLIGYGPYRTIDTGLRGKRLHAVVVYSLPAAQCGGVWALRHLWGGVARAAAACGAVPLCAGTLLGRRRPCYFCAGSPLLRGAVLLAVMTDDRQCGVACEPQLYVNIAMLRDWLDHVTANK